MIKKYNVNYRYIKYIIVFIGIFLFYSPAYAQEPISIDKKDEPQVESSEQAQASAQTLPEAVEILETAETNNDIETNEPSFDVFRPSEDISEDLAVPFPVDI